MKRPRTALLGVAHPILRAGLADALRRGGIRVAADVASLAEAVELARELRPGVVVLDADPVAAALAATKLIVGAVPDARVVLLGAAAEEDVLLAAVRAGASGYLPRSTSAAGLARALSSVLDGKTAIPRAGVTALVRELRTRDRQHTNVNGVPLTEREAAAVRLLLAGLGTREIAGELGVSPVTVRRYLSTVARKLGVDGREAVLRVLGGAG